MDTARDYYNQFHISNTLNLESIDSIMILDMLTKTNISKTPGIDTLSGTFISDGAEIISGPLAQIINLSIQTSKFPDLCKIAKLIALFKKGLELKPKMIAQSRFYLCYPKYLEKLSIFKPTHFLL